MKETLPVAGLAKPAQDSGSAERPALIDLNTQIDEIRQKLPAQTSGRVTQTIYKSGNLRLVLLGLMKDAELKNHTAPGAISVQVLQGEIEFAIGQQTYLLGAGQTIALAPNIPHAVKGLQTSVFLLTLAV